MNMSQKTVTVRKANVVLTINELDVERYMKKGFDVIDGNGHVMKSAVPNDINVLQKAYTDHLNEIASLKAEIEQLKIQLESKKVAKATEEVPAEEKTEEAPKKKTTRKKKAED